MNQREADHLLLEAEARIDTATAQLMLAIRGVTDAAASQTTALAELTAARDAITALRTILRSPV